MTFISTQATRKRNPWLTCAGCILVIFCTVGCAAGGISAYLPYFISILGLTNAQASSLSLTRALFTIISSFFTIRFYKMIGLRRGLAASMLFTASGYIIFSFSQSYLPCITGVALIGCGTGIGSMVPVSTVISNWFDDKRNLAIGLCAAGSGIATILLPPLITITIERFSLQTSTRLTGLLIVFMSLLTYLLVHASPEGTEAPQLQERSKHTKATISGPGFSRRLAALMCLAYVLTGGPGVAGYTSISVLYSTAGINRMQVSLLISTLGFFVMFGKALCGAIIDKLGILKTGILFEASLALGAAICILANLQSYPIALVSVVFYGMGIAVGTVLPSSYASILADKEHFPQIMNRFLIAFQTGSLLQGMIPGIIADTCGSYVPSYIYFTATAVISLLLMQYCVIQSSKCATGA